MEHGSNLGNSMNIIHDKHDVLQGAIFLSIYYINMLFIVYKHKNECLIIISSKLRCDALGWRVMECSRNHNNCYLVLLPNAWWAVFLPFQPESAMLTLSSSDRIQIRLAFVISIFVSLIASIVWGAIDSAISMLIAVNRPFTRAMTSIWISNLVMWVGNLLSLIFIRRTATTAPIQLCVRKLIIKFYVSV